MHIIHVQVLYSKEEVEGHNELLVQMLAVMEPLVSYGFYWKDEEINEITKFLIDIIDGNHDRPKKSETNKCIQYRICDRMLQTIILNLLYILVFVYMCFISAYLFSDAYPYQVVNYQQKKRFKSNERNQKIFHVKTRYIATYF